LHRTRMVVKCESVHSHDSSEYRVVWFPREEQEK
jgi:hypothetical protein